MLAGLGRATLGQGNAGKQPGQGADRTEAENLTSNLRAAFDLARRSKLAGRDPGAFQNSVQQIADTHGIGTVHLASGKLMQALMAPGIDAAGVLRRMPATLAQLRDLPVQGGDLAIPTGELIAGISGSGAEAAILPHLRRVTDALSVDQLRAVALSDATVGVGATTAVAQLEKGPSISTFAADRTNVQPPQSATSTVAKVRPSNEATPAARQVTVIPARNVRYSQNSVSYNKIDRQTGKRYTYDDLAHDMKGNGWIGDPVDVVEMKDGALTSLDNTRLRAANEAGIEIHAVLHKFDDKLTPAEMRRFKISKAGYLPQTWGEAATGRIAKQSFGFSEKYPHGSLLTPRLTGKPQ